MNPTGNFQEDEFSSLTPILFLAFEEKDLMSLSPIWDEVVKHRPNSKLFSVGFNRQGSDEFFPHILDSAFPIIVSSSPGSAVKWMELLRPRWSYYFVGVEHGLSPFKKFTYSRAFLCYDEYFAPSRLWQKRLQKLYPNSQTHFRLGGYLKAMHYNNNLAANTDIPKKDNLLQSEIVIVFSWGVREDEIYNFPDLENLTILLHPSQVNFHKHNPFKKTKVIRSNSDVTVDILKKADLILGDISSLTFEISRSKTTYYFLDRKFYIDNYDIKDSFISVGSNDYGRIPETDIYIPKDFILNKSDIELFFSGKGLNGKKPLSECPILDNIFNPEDNQHCIPGLLKIANRYDNMLPLKNSLRPDLVMIEFVRNAYLNILDRQPDRKGLFHYVEKLRKSEKSLLIAGLDVLKELAESEEARNKYDRATNAWPLVQVITGKPTQSPKLKI